MTGTFTFLTQKEESILSYYWFYSKFFETKSNNQVLLDNLERFREELIKKGINRNIINFLKFQLTPKAKLESAANWKEYWEAFGFASGFIPWYKNKEIRIFKMPDVDIRIVKVVQDSYDGFVRELNLDFKIVIDLFHKSTMELVKKNSLPNGRFDSMDFHIEISSESSRDTKYGGSQHGDITIVNQLSKDRQWAWGGTHFDFGSCIIYVENQRQQNLDFIRNVAKHEAAHMFGYRQHCDETNVKGYTSRNCLTLVSCTNTKLCDKCRDAIIHIWKGIEQRTNKRYFKRKFLGIF